ncbi:hypothetical protein LGL08_23020 [Clostridium estertheticum]|uniref:hypothetical protein n=1 Tax=Clostridium estertheticum TaxID=238834 RepID=UPI001CF47879|nr:hypothetical protein [Clostridium estertheticum]MCB2309420.1 hypothetical protein [Clostridium estertheticum]MCB2347864.1 hypothetical protein [Clostridium estertheticum]MCB2352375.1 hypothetical protein [Clostridium estertheticum]WAG48575.1 hypothetical protein LL127_23725 [Clostridium estertheticum]
MNNLFNNMGHRIGDKEVFDSWIKNRNIVKYLESYPTWRKVTKKGLRGLRDINYNDEFPLRDHVTLWRDESGRKVLVSQPYAYYPGDMESAYAPPNIHYVKGESEMKSTNVIDKLKDWCEVRGLEVEIYNSAESWYNSPGSILIEIREKCI